THWEPIGNVKSRRNGTEKGRSETLRLCITRIASRRPRILLARGQRRDGSPCRVSDHGSNEPSLAQNGAVLRELGLFSGKQTVRWQLGCQLSTRCLPFYPVFPHRFALSGLLVLWVLL
ncbi:hypothetical protein M758_10G151300, partial [Ceratodon purpureus]